MEEVFNVLKGPFAKEFKRTIAQKHPELTDKISTKHLKEVQNFIDGFSVCFNAMVEQPFNKSEVKGLILQESLTYLESKLKRM